MFWFQKEEEKSTKKNKKEGAALCRTQPTIIVPALSLRSTLIACTNTTTYIKATFL